MRNDFNDTHVQRFATHFLVTSIASNTLCWSLLAIYVLISYSVRQLLSIYGGYFTDNVILNLIKCDLITQLINV